MDLDPNPDVTLNFFLARFFLKLIYILKPSCLWQLFSLSKVPVSNNSQFFVVDVRAFRIGVQLP